jgi:hydrogenase maturation protease
MTKLLIAGVGNTLCGDLGIGPFAIQVLKTLYEFQEGVVLADLGTSLGELPPYFSRGDMVILIESIDFRGASGDIRLFRGQNGLRNLQSGSGQHSDSGRIALPHAELTGPMEDQFLLIGVKGTRFETGSKLSKPVRQCIPHILDAVRRELYRVNVWCEPKANARSSDVWWYPTKTAV